MVCHEPELVKAMFASRIRRKRQDSGDGVPSGLSALRRWGDLSSLLMRSGQNPVGKNRPSVESHAARNHPARSHPAREPLGTVQTEPPARNRWAQNPGGPRYEPESSRSAGSNALAGADLAQNVRFSAGTRFSTLNPLCKAFLLILVTALAFRRPVSRQECYLPSVIGPSPVAALGRFAKAQDVGLFRLILVIQAFFYKQGTPIPLVYLDTPRWSSGLKGLEGRRVGPGSLTSSSPACCSSSQPTRTTLPTHSCRPGPYRTASLVVALGDIPIRIRDGSGEERPA